MTGNLGGGGDPRGRPLPARLDPRGGRGGGRDAERAPRDGSGHPALSRRRRLVRGGRIVAAVASFLVLLGSGYGWAEYRSFASGVRQVDALGSTGPDRDGPAQNILLIGDDSRPANASPQVLAELSTQEDGGSVNTDTLMILHIPAGGGQASVVSIPRDSWVDIPGAGKGKINSAFAIGSAHGGGDAGGMKELIQTVQNLTGVTIDHFVKVSLLGFYEIAQALGPIQVCLNQAVDEPLSGVHLPAGVSTLNAKQALSFVRQRHQLPRGDLDREVRQQYFLSRELAKVTSSGVLLNPGKLNQLLTAVSDALETDPKLDLLDFATQFRDVSAGSVHFATIPTTGTPTIRDENGNDVSIVAVDTVALPAFFAQLGGVPAAYTKAAAADPASVSVKVVNGTGTSGLATTTGTALKRLGFTVAGTANAPATTTLTTVTYPAGQEAQAKAVAAQVPGALVAQVGGVQQVTLTLGTDGLRVASPSSGGSAGSGGSSGRSATSSAPAPAAPTSAAPTGKAYSATSCIN